MARRTKADAQATRDKLLDTAEHLFLAKGVARTSLNDIAVEAGTTRGAIYWHFKDKADLFNAMMARATLPFEDSLAAAARAATDPATSGTPAVERLRANVRESLALISRDERARRVLEIATHKVEYVDDMQAVRERHLAARESCVMLNTALLAQAAHEAGRALPLPPEEAALGLFALLDGLLQNWMLAPAGFALEALGLRTLDLYLIGLGLRQAPATPGT